LGTKKVWVQYRDGLGHVSTMYSDAIELTLAITVPTITGSYPQSSSLPVSWTVSSAVATGEFAVWAQSPSGWYIGKIVPRSASTSYATNLTLAVPKGSGYRVRVGYRPTVGSGAWTVYGLSGGSFTVTLPLTITLPTITGSYPQSSSLPVSWTTNQVVSSGEFAVWAVSPSGWYIGKIVARNATTSYATNLTLAVPKGSGYQIRVGYRPVAGSGAWSSYGLSGGTFTVTVPLTITLPSITGTRAQNSSLPVTWTISSAVSTGEFAVWAVSPSGWYIGKIVARNATTSYATSITLAVPKGSGYQIRVGYRPTVGSGAWSPFGLSGGSFTVN